MLRRLGGWAVLSILLLAATVVRAEGEPAGRWWRMPRVAQQLQLSDSEIQHLEKAFEQSRLRMIELKSHVEAEQFKLQTMMEKRTLDEAEIKAQHNRLEQARSALAEERFAFFVQVRRIIGPERFQRLLDMHGTVKKRGQ